MQTHVDVQYIETGTVIYEGKEYIKGIITTTAAAIKNINFSFLGSCFT